MEDGRKNNGGHSTKGKAGRPSKVDEEKANYLFVTALKQIYKKDQPDDAKIEFIKDLAEGQRGQIFIAEHVFGKAKDVVENRNFNTELTKEEAEILKGVFLKAY